MNIYQHKAGGVLDSIPLDQVSHSKVFFSEGEDALHQVELVMKNGRNVEIQMSTSEWESFYKQWAST